MRLFVLIASLIFLPLAQLLLATPTQPANSAEITGLTLTPASVELGRQVQNQTIERTITLLNSSDTLIEILGVSADCGCTTPALKETRLAPGASTELIVRFETRTYSGEIRRRVQISTAAGIKTLPLTVSVAPYKNWDIAPMPLMIPPSVMDQSARLDITVHAQGEAIGAKITAATINLPWIEARLGPATGDSQIVTLIKAPGSPAGTHSAVLTLQTTDTTTPTLTTTVLVPVASSLRIAPNPVVIPRSKAGQEASASFRVIGWRGASAPVVTSNRGTVTSLGEMRGEYTFQITWTPEAAGTAVWAVKVLRDNKTELEVPVMHHVTE